MLPFERELSSILKPEASALSADGEGLAHRENRCGGVGSAELPPHILEGHSVVSDS